MEQNARKQLPTRSYADFRGSFHSSIVGHYVLCNITLRDKSGDAIRNQSQFVHRNRLTIRTISFISKDAARGNFNPHKLL